MGNQCCEGQNTMNRENISLSQPPGKLQIKVADKLSQKDELSQKDGQSVKENNNENQLPLLEFAQIPNISEVVKNNLDTHHPFADKVDPHAKAFKIGSNIYQGFLDEKYLPKGYGKLFYSNGSVFVGQFQKGAANGQGHFVWPDGSYYQGKIIENIANDEHGVYECSVFKYNGTIKNNEFNGQGTLEGKDGSFSFSGTFKNGKKTEGKLVWRQQISKTLPLSESQYVVKQQFWYQGHFDQNQNFIGNGRLQTPKGLYEGQFVNNKKEGKGTFYYTSGLKYEGEYKNDVHEGYGKIIGKSKQIVFEGEFHNGLPHGKGKVPGENGQFHEISWNQGVSSKIQFSNSKIYK